MPINLPANLTSSEYPMLFFPVKLETRFYQKTKLRVRILPDAVFVNSHNPKLTKLEYQAGANFWNDKKKETQEQAGAAWNTLINVVGVNRAAYVARKTQTVLAAESIIENNTAFSELSVLPDSWVIVGIANGTKKFEVQTNPVLAPLKIATDFSKFSNINGDLNVPPELRWMFNFEEAKRVGMAAEINLDLDSQKKIDQLFVYGVVTKDRRKSAITNLTQLDISKLLNEIFENHLYSESAGFAPQGLHTNNTEASRSGWSSSSIDSKSLWEREFGTVLAYVEPSVSSGDLRPSSSAVTVTDSSIAISKPSEELKNYRQIEKAMGLVAPSVFRKYEWKSGFEFELMQSMNKLLWPVTIGELCSTLLLSNDIPEISETKVTQLKNLYLNHVVGGANLPALRVGNTPYGLLPVMYSGNNVLADTVENEISSLLKRILPNLNLKISKIPTISEVSQGAEPGDKILEIFSQQPYPEEFRMQKLKESRGLLGFWFGLICVAVGDTVNSQSAKNIQPILRFRLADLNTKKYNSLKEQLTAFEQLKSELTTKYTEYSRKTSSADKQMFEYIKQLQSATAMGIDFLKDYQTRGSGLNLVSGGQMGAGSIHKDVSEPNLFYANYSKEIREWPIDRLVKNGSETDSNECRAYLLWLRKYSESLFITTVKPGVNPYEGKSAPLLFQLIYTAIGRMARTDVELKSAISAIDVLLNCTWDQLELLLKQSLSLSSIRPDAWQSALASSRIEKIRKIKPQGVQLAAYGWVENLIPAYLEQGNSPNQGFVHTPSLTHSKTASLLRAGWNAYKEENANDIFAVDLSSERMKQVACILDAVRQGHDLGDILGARLEKLLQKNQKSYWIYPLRESVAKLSNTKYDPAQPIVDGLALLEVWKEGVGSLQLEQTCAPFFEGINKPKITEIQNLITKIDDLLDAVNDACLADSVHSLVQGNLSRAGSALTSISKAESNLPELDVLKINRAGSTMNTKVVLLSQGTFDKQSIGLANESKAIDPRHVVGLSREQMLFSILGPIASIKFVVEKFNEKNTLEKQYTVTVADINKSNIGIHLGYQNLLELIEDHAKLDLKSLKLQNILKLYVKIKLDPDVNSSTVIKVNWAQSTSFLKFYKLKSVLRKARPMLPQDWFLEDSELAQQELASAKSFQLLISDMDKFLIWLSENYNDLDEQLSKRDSGSDRIVLDSSFYIQFMLRLSCLNYQENLPNLSELEQLGSIKLTSMRSKLNQLNKNIELAKSTWIGTKNENEKKQVAAEIFKLFISNEFQYLGALHESVSPRLVTGFTYGYKRFLTQKNEFYDWLEKYKYIRDPLRHLADIFTIDAAQSIRPCLSQISLAQWPECEKSNWIGRGMTNSDSNSVGVIAMSGEKFDKSKVGTEPVCGLFIDEIIERIPAAQQDTAVGFHFDAPNTEAPQVILLGVTPATTNWSHEQIILTLQETFKMSKIRMLETDVVNEYEHFIPAIFASKALYDDGQKVV